MLHPRNVDVGGPPTSVTLDGGNNGIKHVLVAEWLWKEIYGPPLHGADRHWNIAISGHHHHRQVNTGSRELGLDFQAIHIGQADVDNNASRCIRQFRVQEVAGGSIS